MVISLRICGDEDADQPSHLGISEAQAIWNYKHAGTLVPEPPSDFREDKYRSILTPTTSRLFDEVSQPLKWTVKIGLKSSRTIFEDIMGYTLEPHMYIQ